MGTHHLNSYSISMSIALRTQCKNRLKAAFESVLKTSGAGSFILVLDDSATKVLNSCVKMMELLDYGVSSIEKLELTRKKYTQIEACYLIHPDSYEAVLKDFEDGPQYASIHIFTISRIAPYVMEAFSKNQFLPRHLKTLKQLNLSYTLHGSNEVKLCSWDTRIFQKSLELTPSTTSQFITRTLEELVTILVSTSAFYQVDIFLQKSTVVDKIATGLKEKLEALFKIYDRTSNPCYTPTAPLTTFLLLGRNYDPVSPLVRDYYYKSLLYECLNIKDNKVENFGKENKTLLLDENDEVYMKYRSQHIMKVLTGLPEDFNAFTKSNAITQKMGDKEGTANMHDMAEVIKKMPQYIQSKDKYTLHLESLESITEAFQNENQKVQGQIQQSITLGMTEDGRKLKDKEFVQQFFAVATKASSTERAKLAMIAMMCMDLKANEKKAVVDLFSKSDYKYLHTSLNFICSGMCKLNPRKQSKTAERILLDRFQPKIEEAVRAIINEEQNELKFMKINGSQARGNRAVSVNKSTSSSVGRKKIVVEAEVTVKPRLIVVMLSALGYNEMRALAQFQATHQLIYVSHNFVTAKQYMDLLKNVSEEEL